MLKIQFGCVVSGEEIPDPIPHSEVKLTCGEGSARETWCQISKMHPLFLKPTEKWVFFCLIFGFNLINKMFVKNAVKAKIQWESNKHSNS